MDRSLGGRPRVDPRRVMAGVVHVLRTGCPWKEVRAPHGPGSTLHRYYKDWVRAGVFHRIWEAGLAEAEELEGIAWRWQRVGNGGRHWIPAVGERRRDAPATAREPGAASRAG